LLSLLRGHRMKKVLRRMLDESEFLSTTAFERYRGAPRDSLRIQGGPYGSGCGLRTGGIGIAAVRRQFQLARADLVSDEFPDRRVAAEIPSLLRRRLQGGMPDGVGAFSHHREVAAELSHRLSRIF